MKLVLVNCLIFGILILEYHGYQVKGPKLDTDMDDAEQAKVTQMLDDLKEELIEDYMKTDDYILPYLRAKDGNVEKATKLIRTNMKWIAENPGLLTEEFPASMHRQYPYKIELVDKWDRPVLQMPFGRWNLRNAIISGERAKLLRYFDQMIEKVMEEVRKTRKEKDIDINRFFYFADLNGYSFTTHGCLNCVPLILDFAIHLETYFPARAYKIYAINTPRLFIPVFELIKPLMSTTTAEGFTTFPADKSVWKPALLEYIPASELPREYGGTGTGGKKKSKGPKENEVSE